MTSTLEKQLQHPGQPRSTSRRYKDGSRANVDNPSKLFIHDSGYTYCGSTYDIRQQERMQTLLRGRAYLMNWVNGRGYVVQ